MHIHDPTGLVVRELYSAALGRSVRYGAYVPQRESQARYPVLLLLHGADGAYTDFCDHAHAQLLQLSAAHGLIFVLPEGAKDGWWVDSPLVQQHRYATHLLSEVLPDIALWLPANERRSIAGISAGGNAAIVSALTHPALFVSVSSLSGALDLEWARHRPALQRALGEYDDDPALWQRWSARHVLQRQRDTAHTFPLLLTVGTRDLWAESNRVLRRAERAADRTHLPRAARRARLAALGEPPARTHRIPRTRAEPAQRNAVMLRLLPPPLCSLCARWASRAARRVLRVLTQRSHSTAGAS
jgi:S-formylglutathione hydrolase FrmB